MGNVSLRSPHFKRLTTSTTTTSPTQDAASTTRSPQTSTQRPPLARRPRIKARNFQARRSVLNRPTYTLETILLNLSLEDLIVAMHVSKTWLFIACRSDEIRDRLYWWHMEQIIRSRPGTPRSIIVPGHELFAKNLNEGVLITYRSNHRGEYFVFMENHCEQRSLRLLDSKKTKMTLDQHTAQFHIHWHDHAGELLLNKTFTPYKIRSQCPRLTGDRLYEYFKEYHTPEGTNWAHLLEDMMAQSSREKMKRLVKSFRRKLTLR